MDIISLFVPDVFSGHALSLYSAWFWNSAEHRVSPISCSSHSFGGGWPQAEPINAAIPKRAVGKVDWEVTAGATGQGPSMETKGLGNVPQGRDI